MADNNDDIPTKGELAHLREEAERSRFWADFVRELEKEPLEAIDDFQKPMQSKDDEERKAKGLSPRPWVEIAADLEEDSNRLFEHFEEDVRKWDADQRRAKGLEPRSDEELEAELGPGLGPITDQIQEVVMKYDDQKRKEKGLEPRSWREFMEEIEEAGEGLGGRESDGGTALTNMASLSLGNASGLR
ncbi:MAG: hypothetical protein Q9166_003152 [cf. Caloplaca sp. 2 TL-2023]